MYPDLNSDWRSIVNRYNYHFGSIDSLNPNFDDPEKLLEQDLGAAAKNSTSFSSEESGIENVKGFRTWSQKMMLDLLETKARIGVSHPNVEPGASEFNKLLLKEFQKLHPKCMESSRSIYSKLQSIEREEQFRGLRSLASGADFQVKLEPEDDQVVPVGDDARAIHLAAAANNHDRTDAGQSFSSRPETSCDVIMKSDPEAEELLPAVKVEVNAFESDPFPRDELADDEMAPDADSHEAKVFPDESVENPEIEGFEGWTIVMIRDFVACMDVTRKKFSVLKEKEPAGAQIKLVPLLLEGWKEIYPSTTETVKTFQTRIKFLSQQKEVIKKHLGILRSSSVKVAEKEEEPFRWNKGMINDVIDSRKKALAVKDAELKKGHKVSFHALWASEFKKIYPNSSFTSNNLSVHFWTWRKQQQKTASKKSKSDAPVPAEVPQPLPELVLFPSPLLSTARPEWFGSSQIWNRASKMRLLELGRRVEEMMRDQETPNEIKLTGFPNMLYDEWVKAHPDRELDPKLESSRYLNLMYSRVVRDGPGNDEDDEKPVSTWSAASKMLLLKVGQKVEEMLQNPATPNEVKVEGFQNLVLAEWRKQTHPNGSGSESMRSLTMMYNRLQREGLKLETPGSAKEPKTITATWTPKHNHVLLSCMDKFADLAATSGLVQYRDSVIKSWRSKFTKSSISDAMLWRKIADLSVSGFNSTKISPTGIEPEVISLDEIKDEESTSVASRNETMWNPTAIRDLFDSYRKARRELSYFPPKSRPGLAALVHANFVSQHPNCKLVPAILMAKLFSLKSSRAASAPASPLTQPAASPSVVVKKEEVEELSGMDEDGGGGGSSAKKSKSLVFRTWTQAMIDDMMTTRKVAIAMKKKRLEDDPTDSLPMAEIWYEEFMKLHPDYKSTKKNLWRKYKWYKLRMGQERPNEFSPKKEAKPVIAVPLKFEDTKPSSDEAKQPLLRMKSIRRDVFSYLKSVMEEPRIFLPPKVCDTPMATMVPTTLVSREPQLVTPPPLQSFVRPVQALRIGNPPTNHPQSGPFIVPASLPIQMTSPSGQLVRQNVAFISATPHSQLVQTTLSLPTQPTPILPVFPNGGPWTGLPPQQLTIMPVATVADSNAANSNDSIKLPGGATLVAVTDRNVGHFLKPKHLEKPHVTITIGDRQEAGVAAINQQQQQPLPTTQAPTLLMPPQPHGTLTAIMTTPTQQIPLTIPYPINVQQFQARPPMGQSPAVVQPPPLAQLRPHPEQLSLRVKSRLAEINIPDSLFNDLVKLYSKTREEFVSTMKKGYIAYFPFMLGTAWKEKFPLVSNFVTGRKLAALIELYTEDQRKGKFASPEYLTKVPSNFAITELLLKQILVCHAETRNWLMQHVKTHPPYPVVYHEMCRRWPKVHPEVRMTTKQLISIHHVLNYEPYKAGDATPEINCQLTEIWKMMDKEVSIWSVYDEAPKKVKVEVERPEEEPSYDEDNVSMEQLQDWFLSTENIVPLRKHQPQPRPRVGAQKVKLSSRDRRDLSSLSRSVNRRWLDCRYRHRRLSQMDLLHRTWLRLRPGSSISKQQLMAACVRELGLAQKKSAMQIRRQIDEWRLVCEDFCKNEENVAVVDEVEEEKKRQIKKEKQELLESKRAEAAKSQPATAGGFSGRLTSLSRHANLTVDNHLKDYSKDENVLAYIGEMQKTSAKSSQPITWTAEVIRDLMKARAEARRRKRIWEDWAVKKYGGVGIAYNLPNVKFTKVDDMFREEWIKLRPEMSSLSIWTLVSYARKFDNLKKQLLEANGGKVEQDVVGNRKPGNVEAVPAKPTFSMVFFANSSIPKYDLDKLEKLRDIPPELKALLKTRQSAKEEQSKEENSKLTLGHLWDKAWKELQPGSRLNGQQLQRLLCRYEQNPVIRARVAPALVKRSETDADPSPMIPQPDEILRVKPRSFVFPENEEEEEITLFCYENVAESRGSVRKVFATLDRDIMRPNHPGLEIPIVTGKPVSYPENSSEFQAPAKAYGLLEKSTSSFPEITFCPDEGMSSPLEP